jgi:hypothetical protein
MPSLKKYGKSFLKTVYVLLKAVRHILLELLRLLRTPLPRRGTSRNGEMRELQVNWAMYVVILT